MKSPSNGEPPQRPGPKAETLKIKGMDWEEAVRRSFQVKKPPEGWPDTVKKPPKEKRGPK